MRNEQYAKDVAQKKAMADKEAAAEKERARLNPFGVRVLFLPLRLLADA